MCVEGGYVDFHHSWAVMGSPVSGWRAWDWPLTSDAQRAQSAVMPFQTAQSRLSNPRQEVHIHGELLKTRWVRGCDAQEDLATEVACPSCQRAGALRPQGVWFSEMPLDRGCTLGDRIQGLNSTLHSSQAPCTL
jgi:hypothetical protein